MKESILIKSFVAIAMIVLFAGSFTTFAKPKTKQDNPDPVLWEIMKAANQRLEANGANYRVDMAEYYTGGVEEMGQVVFFSDRGNKQLAVDWVPGDPRRAGWSSGTGITYAVDQVEADNVVPIGASSAAIDRAMATWQNVKCSNIGITQRGPFGGANLGVVFGGVGIASDITHSGFVPLPPGVLGVTFTFLFVNGGVPTDTDNNKTFDAAFREIYYNVNFNWGINTNFDIETVALHEVGHGLSQGHFGKVFGTFANGKIHFAPRAVMNAGYSGIQQSILKTDNGGHCSNWGSWPRN